MEKNFCFWDTSCSEIEWMNERQKPEKPLRLMQTALTSLWCCAGWKFPSKLRIFSRPHHPPVGLHPSQGNKQNLFPAGTASYLWIHQVQSRSDWAAVRRSRWRIHRATIERFLSLPLFLFITLSLSLFPSSSLPLFVSLSLRLMRQLMGINGGTFLSGSAPG